MAGVLRAAPQVVVLVGESAFMTLTGSSIGPELLLRLYQAAFGVSAQQSGYRIQDVVEAVYGTFRQRAKDASETFLDAILHDAIGGTPSEQDSRVFRGGRERGEPVARAESGKSSLAFRRRRKPKADA
jgi:hypothetical protein